MAVPSPQRLATAALKESRGFFEEHGLNRLVQALPDKATLRKSQRDRIQEARENGFTDAFVFPASRRLDANTATLIRRLLTDPGMALDPEHRYEEPWFLTSGVASKAKSAGRPAGPYLLLLRPDGYPKETQHQPATRLRERFAARGWTGLSFPEYAVLQRRAALRHGDHRFDAYGSQRMWLLGSTLPGKDDNVFTACWIPKTRNVNVGWCKATHKNKSLGAHPAVLVEL